MSFDLKNLTVAIPTFNREDSACALISKLEEIRGAYTYNLLVVDNNSDSSIRLENIVKRANGTFIKRAVNVGPTANIMRLFEEVKTEFILVLCDDEYIDNRFFEIIKRNVDRAIEDSIVAVKFSTCLNKVHRDFYIKSVEDFCAYNSNSRHFGGTALISSWLFNRISVSPYLRYSYLYAGFQAPHLIVIMSCLKRSAAKLLYSEESPVIYHEPEAGAGWNVGLTYGLMLSNVTIIDFLTDSDIKNLCSGIVGSSSRRIVSNLYRYKSYRSGLYFNQIRKIVAAISIYHLIITFAFRIAFHLIPRRLWCILIGDTDAQAGVDRM